MHLHIVPNSTILFQGDSITDCNRRKLISHDLGDGYVNLIHHFLSTHYAHLNLKCINRGISGNRTTDLKLRWRHDCLNIEPQFLSLLVGINDTWRKYDLGLTTSTEKFYTNYTQLLDRFQAQYPHVPILLMSPFLLPVTEEQETWFEDLRPKIEVVETLARQYNTLYIPLQDIFESQLTSTYPAHYWVKDGVHPTLEGHSLIAKEWIKVFTHSIHSKEV